MLPKKSLVEWAKLGANDPTIKNLVIGHLESLATIDEDALHKRFLKELIKNYVMLEKRLDALLKNTLPATVADEIKDKGHFLPRSCLCTILFTDLAGFTALAEKISRASLVEMLNTLFTQFDDQIQRFHGTKIKTIGDAYMAVFGAPIEDDNHAFMAIGAALAMMEELQRLNVDAPHPLAMRAGIHSGQVMAGVVGKERMQFDVFGDDVNIAARLESASANNRINVSETTYLLTKDHFTFESRGAIRLKNKADMDAYFVIGEKKSTPCGRNHGTEHDHRH